LSSSRTKRHVAPFVGPSWHIAAVWLLIALIAQVTIVHYVAIRDVVPSCVLVVVVWYSVRAGVRRAAIFGLIAGLCEDALAAQTGGAWTISTTLTAVATSLLARGFFADSIPLVGLVTGVATLLRALFFWTTMALEGYPPGLGAMHLREALFQAALNVIVMIVAMLAVRRFDTTGA
jgi:rod shape-determining protein MreD